MPEYILLLQWVGTKHWQKVYEEGMSTDEILKGLQNSVISELNEHDKIMHTEIWSAYVSGKTIDIPEVSSLFSVLAVNKDVLYHTLPTRDNEKQFYIRDALNYTVSDMVSLHYKDMNTMLCKNFKGHVHGYAGSTFSLYFEEPVLRCEVENLIYTGSIFNCNGYVLRMLPFILYEE
jgi:hypothetical protein